MNEEVLGSEQRNRVEAVGDTGSTRISRFAHIVRYAELVANQDFSKNFPVLGAARIHKVGSP